MICLRCNTNQAVNDKVTGQSPYCEGCQETLSTPSFKIPEFTTEEIKEARQSHKEDIIPHHYKGHLNKEWLESKYGGIRRAKQEGYTDKEIKDAQYVYSGNLEHSYYKKHN